MANPSMRTQSRAIEGVSLIPSMDMVHFQGGMDIVHDIYQLPLATYSDIQNMRPTRPGFVKRKGMAKLHSTADSTNKCMSLFCYSKGKQVELHTYAQMSDGDTLEATANPPGTTVGAFGASIYNTTDTTNMLPASWAVVNDRLLMTDGTGYPRIYTGNTEYIAAFIVYKGAAAIPDVPILGEDYSFNVADGDSTTVAILDSLSVLTDYDAVFIRTDTPADTFTFTVSKPNGDAAVAQLHYWNGAWAAVSSLTDNTIASAGKTLGQTGTMTFTMTTDHKPKYMFGSNGYWYRLSLASGALDAEVEISGVTYNSRFLAIQNVWDGIPTSAIEAYKYDGTDKTYRFYSPTGIEIGGLTSSDKVYVNTIDPAIGMYVTVGSVPNETAATTVTIKYFNGSTWASTSAADSTTIDSKSLASDGWLTWTHPSDEQPTVFQSSQYYSYWYEITFDKTLTADMIVGVEFMPYYDMRDFGKCYALCSFKQRVIYSFEKLPGYVAISSYTLPTVLNGNDFAIQDIGDGRANKAVCIKKFYNEVLVWQEEKGKEGGCLTLIEGESPDTFGKRIISTSKGTFSSKSAVVVDGIPVIKTKDETPSKVTMAYFLSRDGVYRTDGRAVESISQLIQDYFDPKESKCIRRGYEKEHWMDWDSQYNVIRVGLVSGSTATVPNVFLIYDPFTHAWSHDVLTYPLSCHAEVEAVSGQYPVLQIGGGTADGTIYILNSGTTDVATAITAYVTMEFDGNGHNIHIEELLVRATGTLTVTPTVDGTAKSDISIT